MMGLQDGLMFGPSSHRGIFLRALLASIDASALGRHSSFYSRLDRGRDRIIHGEGGLVRVCSKTTDLLRAIFEGVLGLEPDGVGPLTETIFLWVSRDKQRMCISRDALFPEEGPCRPFANALLAISCRVLDGGSSGSNEAMLKAALALTVVALNGGHLSDDTKRPPPDVRLLDAIQTIFGVAVLDVVATVVRHQHMMPDWVKKALCDTIDKLSKRDRHFARDLVGMVGEELCCLCLSGVSKISHPLANQPRMRQLLADEIVQHPKRQGFKTNVIDVIDTLVGHMEVLRSTDQPDPILIDGLYERNRWGDLWKNIAKDYHGYFDSKHEEVLLKFLGRVFEKRRYFKVPGSPSCMRKYGWVLDSYAKSMAMKLDVFKTMVVEYSRNMSPDDSSSSSSSSGSKEPKAVVVRRGLAKWIMTGLAGSLER